jgi:hypothetical protein
MCACVRACVQLFVFFVLNMHLHEQLMQQRQLLSRNYLMSQTAKPKVHERVCARAPTPAWHAYPRTQPSIARFQKGVARSSKQTS